MRKSLPLVLASVASIVAADVAVAQPRPYDQTWGQQQARPSRDRDARAPDRRDARRGQSYYYNGRWVDHDEWNRRAPERDRWVRSYNRKWHNRDDDDSAALIAGIIGFALGAAIVGSQQEAEHARTADESWDSYCARRYRSYDPRSRTYMGYDGVRHYCK